MFSKRNNKTVTARNQEGMDDDKFNNHCSEIIYIKYTKYHFQNVNITQRAVKLLSIFLTLQTYIPDSCNYKT